jgi:hypothetical protein
VLPPAVYAEPDVFVISFVAVYAVVVASRVAELVYSETLKVSAPVPARTTEVLKAWIPLKISSLNEVAIKFPVKAIMASSKVQLNRDDQLLTPDG